MRGFDELPLICRCFYRSYAKLDRPYDECPKRNRVGIIRKAKAILTKDALLNLDNASIFLYYIYCEEIWGGANKIHLYPFNIPSISHKTTLFEL